MGRKRSSGYTLQRRIKETIRTLRLRRIKARSGLICPRCYQPTMFIRPKGRLLVLIGCKKCNLGDILPRHPTWKTLDLYNFVCDNWRDKMKVPTFRYKELSNTTFEFLREHVTLGRILVTTITDEDEDVDVMEDKNAVRE